MPKFTNAFLAGLTVEAGRKDRLIFDNDVRGLAVRVTQPAGRAKPVCTFLVQWTNPADPNRKVRDRLDVWGNITIEQAREAARARLGDVAKGRNPKAEREKQRADTEREKTENALTFGSLVEAWSTEYLAKKARPRYAAEATRAIRVGFSHLIDRPATKITRDDAEETLDKLLDDGKPVAAARLRSYASACFGWAMKNRKYRGLITGNPFLGIKIEGGNPERDRVLESSEVAEIWSAAGDLPYPFGPFYQLLILTLQRREEVAAARWSEFDEDLSTWRIPSGRMKARQAHLVHLTGAARAVLRSLPRIEGQDLVFTTTGRSPISGFSQGKRYLDKAITAAREKAGITEPMKPWVIHDLRRAGATWLAEREYDSIVIDRILAHVPGKLRGVAGVYQRAEYLTQRAAAAAAWSTQVAGGEADTQNVVRMHGR